MGGPASLHLLLARLLRFRFLVHEIARSGVHVAQKSQ